MIFRIFGFGHATAIELMLSGIPNSVRRLEMKKCLLVLVAMVLCFSTLSWAQDTANITGTVTDSTGAVIPNSKITLSNPDKAYTRETVSDTAGIYTVSTVPIGNYVVTCEAAGFQKLVRSGITLSVG